MISSDKIAMECRRNGCNQDAVINHQYDRACSLYCRDVADVDEELAEARAEIERLTRERDELKAEIIRISRAADALRAALAAKEGE